MVGYAKEKLMNLVKIESIKTGQCWIQGFIKRYYLGHHTKTRTI